MRTGDRGLSFAQRVSSSDSPLRDQLREIRENLAVVKHYATINNLLLETIMATSDDFRAEIAAVKTSVDNAITLIDTWAKDRGTAGGTVVDADVEAGLNDLRASRERLDRKVTEAGATANANTAATSTPAGGVTQTDASGLATAEPGATPAPAAEQQIPTV